VGSDLFYPKHNNYILFVNIYSMESRLPLYFLFAILLIFGASVNAQLTVHFIDVGQGDAELLQSGSHSMLIDAGPSSAGGTVVSYLKGLGISNLDVVVATHPHEDHIGGMVDVLNSFPVGLYVDNGATHTSTTYENVMTKLNSKQIPYAEVTTGKMIPFADGIKVQVMNPSSLTGDLNEDSIVLKVTDGSEKFLFMGDAADGSGDLSAQVLKVTHHGSNTGTSSSFLSKVNPEVAVIEVGAGNTYGHPASGTLNKLHSNGVKVYRTDEDGNVVIKSDGSSYTIQPASGGSLSSGVTAPAKTSTPTYSSPVYVAPIQTPPPVYSSPVASSTGACNCNGPDLNCKDFSSWSESQSCYDYCKSQGKGDCFGLDKNKDGSACDSMK
jgi:competence protein ComEC